MTNNDVIEIIKDVTWKDFGRHPDFPEAREAAIQALNEVEEYRAIGTPEELRSLKERAFTGIELAQIAAMQMRLKEYERIGTPEECLRNKDFLRFLANSMNQKKYETYLRIYNAVEKEGCDE